MVRDINCSNLGRYSRSSLEVILPCHGYSNEFIPAPTLQQVGTPLCSNSPWRSGQPASRLTREVGHPWCNSRRNDKVLNRHCLTHGGRELEPTDITWLDILHVRIRRSSVTSDIQYGFCNRKVSLSISDGPAFGKQKCRLWFYWFSRLKYNPYISADPLLYSYYTSLDARQNKTTCWDGFLDASENLKSNFS